MQRTLYGEDHELFRQSFRRFLEKEVLPFHERWEENGQVDRAMILTAGANGFLGMNVPAELGGGGAEDFRFNAVIGEEIWRAGVPGSGMCLTLHNDVVMPYLLSGTDEQRQRWLPGACSGEILTAIAMSEPAAGSDLGGIRTTAIRDGDHYVVNGAKTFITNGLGADLVVVAVKTDPGQRHRGMSIVVVETGTDGFTRGRKLEKLGLHSQDTAELFFSDARVPAANLLGPEGSGFAQLMEKLPQERLGIAIGAVAGAEAALEWTIEYCKQREAFGQPIGSFQNTRFVLAELATEVEIARMLVDAHVDALGHGSLSAVDAAKSKWWCTELQRRVVDRCLQLHGGYGYMTEYPIARAWRDMRAQTIYGGSTEIMKEIIGRSLGL